MVSEEQKDLTNKLADFPMDSEPDCNSAAAAYAGPVAEAILSLGNTVTVMAGRLTDALDRIKRLEISLADARETLSISTESAGKVNQRVARLEDQLDNPISVSNVSTDNGKLTIDDVLRLAESLRK